MEIKRRLRKVGGSVMVPVPPEVLEATGLKVDQEVRLQTEGGRLIIEPVDLPEVEMLAWAREFIDRHRDAFDELAVN
jgi:antitoxin component of MazEF toxin-antitoxin module